jgi:hypothetical protein
MRVSTSTLLLLALLLGLSLGLVVSGCGDEADAPGVASATTAVMASATEPADLTPAAETAGAADYSHALEPATALVPASIAGVPLSGWVQGEAARTQVEQLHGKVLGAGMDEAWVAEYGDGQAVLWVTRAVLPADARDLYTRMVDRIALGESPFSDQQPIGVPGVEGYSLDGLGQRHFYFMIGGDVYWLAIDPELADAGLSEMTAQALAAAGTE